jgi:3-hydroxyacyl-CoA dehydrogenase
VDERIAIAGSGAIGCGLAKVAAEHGEVVLWARSYGSAQRASERLADSDVRVTRDFRDLRDASIVVEAIAEEAGAKRELYARLALADGALLATTTSALSIAELAGASGRPERFFGLHVFNPVPKMQLVEVAFPAEAEPETRERAYALCAALGKTPVEVPDIPGFVVNRLLFPYLFAAVRLLEESGLEPEAVDTCMTLGAGHPMGPLALLDYVGLDVAAAIARSLGEPLPAKVEALIAEGATGRKATRGFYAYPP